MIKSYFQVPVAEREAMAAKLLTHRHQWVPGERLIYQRSVPGPNFCTNDMFWTTGCPTLDTFLNGRSFLLWEVMGQTQENLAWLEQPVDDWERYDDYRKLFFFVNHLVVVNDPAERYDQKQAI